MILTQDDYFRFQHKESYVSRKLFTLLQETTTVILGYSLQDFNLNRILNEAKYSKGDRKRSDIFYVSRESVDELSKRYYFSTFGIQVLDDLEIDEFIAAVEDTMEEAKAIVEGAKRLPNIISGDKEYTNDFLKLSRSFMNILMRLQAGGYNMTDKKSSGPSYQRTQKGKKNLLARLGHGINTLIWPTANELAHYWM